MRPTRSGRGTAFAVRRNGLDRGAAAGRRTLPKLDPSDGCRWTIRNPWQSRPLPRRPDGDDSAATEPAPISVSNDINTPRPHPWRLQFVKLHSLQFRSASSRFEDDEGVMPLDVVSASCTGHLTTKNGESAPGRRRLTFHTAGVLVVASSRQRRAHRRRSDRRARNGRRTNLWADTAARRGPVLRR